MKLYSYWRSTAAYRVRIALALKGLEYEYVPVHLIKEGGEQHTTDYRDKNPEGLVPLLEAQEGLFTQSLSIINYLEKKYPEPTLLTDSMTMNAHIEAMALSVACDIHPLNNLRVMNYLKGDFDFSGDDILKWYHHWLEQGFNAIEARLRNNSQDFSFVSYPTIADIFLVGQVYNAHRFNFDMSAYPEINRVNENCLSLEAFKISVPENQIDAD